MSVTPLRARESITYSRIGRLATGTIAFGCVNVNGLKRVPSPAARTIAFTVPLHTSIRKITI
jgi:hypothetical protein